MRFGPLTEEQQAVYKEMDRQAFVESVENTNFWWQFAKVSESRGYFGDDGTLLVGMRIVDKGALYFRGETPIPTALITSVASAPENRRKGYIRSMFAAMFAEQRANGVSLTALYPFFFPFYRAFGYELAGDQADHVVEIEQFKGWRHAGDAGKFVPASVEKDWQTLDSIYSVTARQNLGYIARNQTWYNYILHHERATTPAYIYHDASGHAAGYIVYHFKDLGNWHREMVIHDMGAVDRPAYEALLGFIYNHDSQAEKVRLTLPVDSALPTQLPNPRRDEVRIRPGYMLRLLDVAAALQTRTWVVEAQGAFTMHVTDAMLPDNSGVYSVAVRDGRATVERTGDGAATGLTLDSMALAQLYSGYLSPAKAAAIGRLTVNNSADLHAAQAVFSPAGQPAAFMPDDF